MDDYSAFSELYSENNICDKCQKRIKAHLSIVKEDNENHGDLQSIDNEYCNIVSDIAFNALNESLQSVGASPVKKKRLKESKYPIVKLAKI